jgi:hypothetical protein
MSLTHNATWIFNSIFIKYSSASLGNFTNGTIINNGKFINSGQNNNSATDIVWTWTINGTKLINNGIIESELIAYTGTPSVLPLITLQSGTIINRNLIKNIRKCSNPNHAESRKVNKGYCYLFYL